jgi:hypothetical protein
VHEYNGRTGLSQSSVAQGGALGDPLGLVMGPDGNLLVSDAQANQVKRYSCTTGAFLAVFASTNLAGPNGMTIHQGSLFVTNSNAPQGVQRFNATTGANTGSFTPTLSNPGPRDVKVNPANGRLYVLYYNLATVETFDLTTMASTGVLMPPGSPTGSGGLHTPSALAFGRATSYTRWHFRSKPASGGQPGDRRLHRFARTADTSPPPGSRSVPTATSIATRARPTSCTASSFQPGRSPWNSRRHRPTQPPAAHDCVPAWRRACAEDQGRYRTGRRCELKSPPPSRRPRLSPGACPGD